MAFSNNQVTSIMDKRENFLIFTVSDRHYALRLSNVERIVRAVEVMPLPEASESVLGVINVQGQIVSVLSLRKQFRLPDREIELDDRFVIAHTSHQTIALLVDTVIGVVVISDRKMVPAKTIASGMEYSDGMIKLEKDMVLIPNLSNIIERALPEEQQHPAEI